MSNLEIFSVTVRAGKDLDPWLQRCHLKQLRLESIECGRPSSGWRFKLRLSWRAGPSTVGLCSCGAPAVGRINHNGEPRCCVTCAFHPLGCRCQYGEAPDTPETRLDYGPDEEAIEYDRMRAAGDV